MIIEEAVILAGGFGTRLKHVVSNVPKPMAPIIGKPFLSYVLRLLSRSGMKRVVLSVGYLANVIRDFYGDSFEGLSVVYAEEKEALGTGGAILFALSLCKSDNVLILNGDTLFDIDFKLLFNVHFLNDAAITIALRQVDDTSRYGSVVCNNKGRVECFTEKTDSNGQGMINGGIYVVNKAALKALNLPTKFSFEVDVLQKKVDTLKIFALLFNNYFIDIGIPEDYFRAQKEFEIYG